MHEIFRRFTFVSFAICPSANRNNYTNNLRSKYCPPNAYKRPSKKNIIAFQGVVIGVKTNFSLVVLILATLTL